MNLKKSQEWAYERVWMEEKGMIQLCYKSKNIKNNFKKQNNYPNKNRHSEAKIHPISSDSLKNVKLLSLDT